MLIFRSWVLWFCAFAVPAAGGIAADWPQWRGPNRDGHSPETGLFGTWDKADGPPLEWQAEGLGSGYASVAVVDGRIYTTGNFDDGQAVVAIDARRHRVLWRQPLTDRIPEHSYEGSRSTPTVDGDRLYVVASGGAIACLRTSDGGVIWKRDFADWQGQMMSGWGFSESPLIDGDRVICTPGGAEGVVVALDKQTGDEIWTCRLPQDGDEAAGIRKDLNDGAGYSSAVVSEGGGVRQYIQLVGRGLIGVRARDGKLLWRYDRVANTTANIPTPIVDGDLVFTSTAYGTGAALLRLEADGQRGVKATELYWLNSGDFQNKHGGMVLVDGYIYAGTGNGQGLPICVEMQTGEIAWGPERAEGRGESSLVYADGHLVIRREDGTVMLIRANPERFELVGAFQPVYQEAQSWAHPVIANGRLYLREQGKLMVYLLRSDG